MKTTKGYKLLLILSFFLSLLSHASDSLKVKKTEYYEDGKLVRATFFDSLGRITQDSKNHYRAGFDEEVNNLLIVGFKNGKHSSFMTLNVNIYDDSLFFYNQNQIGYIQNIIYNSKGQYVSTPFDDLILKDGFYNKYIAINSIQNVIIKNNMNFEIKFCYYEFDKIIEEKVFNYNKITRTTTNKYDSLNRIIESFRNDLIKKIVTKTKYFNQYLSIEYLEMEGRRIIQSSFEKIYVNENKQEIRKEKYIAPLKNFRVIGEPKLTFTQENIYENDRIVKIIYEDLLLGKKKVHELKYEFY